MASTLRSQFKATSVKTLKETSKKEDSVSAKGGGRTDRLTFSEGSNKFRIMPKHPSEEKFNKMLCQHWITIENDKGEQVRRTVPNSKIHGGTKLDIIDSYMTFVEENLSAGDSEDAAKLKAMKAWQGGLLMQTSWLCYALKLVKEKEPEFGKLEYKQSVRDEMEKNSFIEDEDEAMETEPFSDIDKGVPIFVKYNSKAKKPADYYQTTLSKNAYPLSDEILEMYSKKTPISQLPEFQYGQAEFELALEGVRLWDENHEVNLFETDEFQAIVKQVAAQYSKSVRSEDDDDDKPSKSTKKSTGKSSTKAAKKTDQFDDMDRNELKAFKKENEIDAFKVVPSMTDDELRDNLRANVTFEEEEPEEEEVEEEEEAPFGEEEEETEEVEEEEEEETPPAKTVKKSTVAKKPAKSQPVEEEEEEEEEAPKKTVVKGGTKSADDIRKKLELMKKAKK